MSAAEANTPPSPDIEFLNVYHCFFTCVVLLIFCQRAEDRSPPGTGLASGANHPTLARKELCQPYPRLSVKWVLQPLTFSVDMTCPTWLLASSLTGEG